MAVPTRARREDAWLVREVPQRIEQAKGQGQGDAQPQPLEALGEQPMAGGEPASQAPADQRAAAAAQGTVVDEQTERHLLAWGCE